MACTLLCAHNDVSTVRDGNGRHLVMESEAGRLTYIGPDRFGSMQDSRLGLESGNPRIHKISSGPLSQHKSLVG